MRPRRGDAFSVKSHSAHDVATEILEAVPDPSQDGKMRISERRAGCGRGFCGRLQRVSKTVNIIPYPPLVFGRKICRSGRQEGGSEEIIGWASSSPLTLYFGVF